MIFPLANLIGHKICSSLGSLCQILLQVEAELVQSVDRGVAGVRFVRELKVAVRACLKNMNKTEHKYRAEKVSKKYRATKKCVCVCYQVCIYAFITSNGITYVNKR